MTNHELIQFADVWRSIGTINAEQIQLIIEASDGELPDDLLRKMDLIGLARALEELRCCNVPKLVQLIDDACEDARAYKHRRAVEIGVD